MNLGVGRIIIIVGLIVAGVVVIANGFSGSSVTAATGTTGPTASTGPTGDTNHNQPSETPTEAPTKAPKPQDPADVTVGVLNGTSTTGLAGETQLALQSDGYTISQEAADSPIKPIAKTIVYYRGGPDADQNQVDAQDLSDTYLNGAPVKQLNPDFETIVKPKTNVLVVLGDDYSPPAG